MKRFITIFISMLAVGLTSMISAEEVSQRDSIINLLVDEENWTIKVDSIYSDRATIIMHKNEFYVYSSTNKVKLIRDKKGNSPLRLSIIGNEGIFLDNNLSQMKDTTLSINNYIYLGLAQEKFARAKFKVGQKTLFLCDSKHEHFNIDVTDLLLDTIGFSKLNAAVKEDTLIITKNDTLSSITIYEPKYSVLISCSLNEKIIFENKDALAPNYNNPEKKDAHKIDDFQLHWNSLMEGDSLIIRMAVLGDNGKFDKEYIKTYYIQIKETEISPRRMSLNALYVIISVIAVVVVVAIIVFSSRKKKKKITLTNNKYEYIQELEKINGELRKNIEVLNVSIEKYKEDISKKDTNNSLLQTSVQNLKYEIESCNRRINDCETTINEKNDKIQILNTEIDTQKRENEKLNSAHELKCRQLQEEIATSQKRISEITSLWAVDKKGVVNFYSRYIENIDNAAKCVLDDADPDSSAYTEFLQITDSMSGYIAFKNKAVDILNQITLPINEMETKLADLLLSDIKYEKSWYNTIARLYAYAKIEGIDTIFGYYDSYEEDINKIYNAMLRLSELLGITDVKIPVLFKDEFSSKNYEYKNTNLVLPQIYTDYIRMLKPMCIYDFSVVGYTYSNEIFKPIVSYFTQN